MSAVSNIRSHGVVGVGYERRSVADLVATLIKLQVSLVVDVRLNPISRKAGLSKVALSGALARLGIAYQHRPELGNPKENRAGFAGPADRLDQARDAYRGLLRRPESRTTLDELAAACADRRVALLCYEADDHRCHRHVVLEEVTARVANGVGSTRRAH
jgi:uncharacterized protein (DUF488 family)